MSFRVRELSLAGVVDHALQLLKATLPSCALAALACNAPMLLAGLVLERHHQFLGMPEDAAAGFQILLFLAWALFVSPLQHGLLTTLLAGRYLDRPVALRAALRHAWRRFGALFLTRLLRYLLVCLGLMALLLPGVHFYVRFFFTEEVTILEGSRLRSALRRSGDLAGRNYLAVLLLAGALLAGPLAVFAAIEELGDFLLTFTLQLAAAMILAPLESALGLVLYFSARCSLEDYDLELLARATESGDSGAAAWRSSSQ